MSDDILPKTPADCLSPLAGLLSKEARALIIAKIEALVEIRCHEARVLGIEEATERAVKAIDTVFPLAGCRNEPAH